MLFYENFEQNENSKNFLRPNRVAGQQHKLVPFSKVALSKVLRYFSHSRRAEKVLQLRFTSGQAFPCCCFCNQLY